jgi:hypothetical protein
MNAIPERAGMECRWQCLVTRRAFMRSRLAGHTTVVSEVLAADVYENVTHVGHIENYFKHLVAIHAVSREH